jgi:hypothetical protein
VCSVIEVFDRYRVWAEAKPAGPTVDPAGIGGLAATLPGPVGRLSHSRHDDRPERPREVVEVCASAGAAVPDHCALVQ